MMDNELEFDFVKSLEQFGIEVHENAVAHGFWPEGRSDGECIALMHSELSEALEALRHGDPRSEKIPEFSNANEELADCIIRILDFAKHKGFDIEEALLAKHEFNKSRPHKHGKEF